jgi:hypothetical protein
MGSIAKAEALAYLEAKAKSAFGELFLQAVKLHRFHWLDCQG